MSISSKGLMLGQGLTIQITGVVGDKRAKVVDQDSRGSAILMVEDDPFWADTRLKNGDYIILSKSPEMGRDISKKGMTVMVLGGSPAIHQLGDIGRDVDAVFMAYEEDGDTLIGNWKFGFGFVGVKVQREHIRKLTHEEADHLVSGDFVINGANYGPIFVDPLDVEDGWNNEEKVVTDG